MLLAAIVGFPARSAAEADEETAREIMQGVMSSFSLPLRDLLEEPEEDAGPLDLIFDGLSGSLSWSYPLDKEPPAEGDGEEKRDITLNANFRYNPISYWFFNTTFYYHLDRDYRQSWEPDFSYSFGYDDWHPYTFSLVYSNFGGNRLNPDRDKGEHFTRFEEGTINLGWKFKLPKKLEYLFIVHPTGAVTGSVNYTLTPRYFDEASGETLDWKNRASLAIKYTIYKWLYFNMTFYWYPHAHHQQPWDPDFTYGFGSFDWHPGAFNLQFNNYAGNVGQGNFIDRFQNGSITGSWSWKW